MTFLVAGLCSQGVRGFQVEGCVTTLLKATNKTFIVIKSHRLWVILNMKLPIDFPIKRIHSLMIHVAPCARTLDAPKPYLEKCSLKTAP
jgi:hypothetical protein